MGYLRPAPSADLRGEHHPFPADGGPSLQLPDPLLRQLECRSNNDVAAIVRKHCDRIAFAHIRNVKHFPNGDFSEASHRDCDGDTGILEILKAYHECGFEGYIRPDHGRHLWGEGPGTVRPGYGLYDRALGIMYMLGAWDLLDKQAGK